jgi:hypothetical protein
MQDKDFVITNEMIEKAEKFYACGSALDWLRCKQRTWFELIEKNQAWAAHAMLYVPGCPLNGIEKLDGFHLAAVLINRVDSPAKLASKLKGTNLASVMASREDCPLDKLYELSETDRELVKWRRELDGRPYTEQ